MKINNIAKSLKGTSGDSFFLIAVRLVTIVCSLLMTRILSEHFSVHEYGTYSQIILLVSTISNFTILGMTDGINYFFCKEQDTEKKNAYISTIFFLQGVVSLIASIVVLFLSVPISNYFDNSDIKGLIVFAAILPVMQNAINLLQIMFIAIGKAKHIAVRNFLVSVLKLIGILAACYLFNSIAIVLVCQLVLEIAQICYFVFSLRKNGYKIKPFCFDKTLIKEILKYCIPMAMFLILKSINKDCDKYVIAAFTNTETLAVYTNAAKQLPFDIIMTSFCTVLLPYMTRYIADKDFLRTQKVYKSFLELAYVCTTILAVAALCVAPELMKFLYTEKYISGIYVFMVYILVDVLSVLNLTMLLSAGGKTKTIMFTSIGAFVVNLLLNILFYNLWGIIGPAIATVVVTLSQGLLILGFSCKEIKTNIFNMFNKRFLCVFLLETLVVGTLTCGLRLLLIKFSIPNFLIMIICCFAFAAPMLLLNFKRLKKNLQVINSCKT